MKLSVSSYSFHQYLKAGKMTLPETVDRAAEIGFAGIEFTGLPTELSRDERLTLARELRRRAEKQGLSVVSYTVGANLWQPDEDARRTEVERLCGELEIAAALGAPVMRHDLVSKLDRSGTGRSFLGMMPTLAKSVREVADRAAAMGIRTCSENHGRVAQDSYRVEQFAALVDHDNYGLLVDMGNFLCVDEDPALAVSWVANLAVHVHAKDMLICPLDTDGGAGIIATRGAMGLKPTAIGHGSVPVARCLSILKRAGYDGWVSLEYEGKADCLDAIRESFTTLTGYLEGPGL
ncbi:MAG: sugar phosphate isomerase/epimerase [Clostridia bacterium]|nr:sugar phosphate isomerase/epimerase [Clostridia bacterium]